VIREIKILCQFDFPSQTVRLWDGAGPYLDGSGHIWAGVVLNDGLDQIESAMNGEAATLVLALSGVDPEVSRLAYEDMEAGEVIGSRVRIIIQPMDEWSQPVGEAEVKFTGRIDNLLIDDVVQGDNVVSQVTVECTNRFDLRTLTSGSVLSDVDQKARSALLNPGAAPDRFCERVTGLSDKSIVWPRYS